MAATTRRPQINHKACDHAATPKARKACRKAHRTAETQAAKYVQAATSDANIFRTLHLTHALAYLADGTPVPACSKRKTKVGEAIHFPGWHAGMATCNRCSGATRGHLG